MTSLIKLLRPEQWIKNGFVLAPLFFAREFGHKESVRHAIYAFLIFCAAASAGYVLNDIHDVENDRRHPRKAKSRPLAAGTVSIRTAYVLLGTLYALVLLGWLVLPSVIPVAAGYILLNVAYTFVLKHRPVIDIFTIAVGFVLRVFAGAAAISVPVSSWMFLSTLCLALYLASIKRRQELKNSGASSRKVLGQYSLELVERYAEMSATGALLFYSMFVVTANPQLVPTVPVVLFGLFRYWYVVEILDGGESPTDALLSDWPMLATLVVWVVLCIWKF